MPKFGSVHFEYNETGWTSPENGGYGRSREDGGIVFNDEGVISINNDSYVPVLVDDTNMRPKDQNTNTGDTGGKKVTVIPVNEPFNLDKLKQLVKDNPLIAAAGVLIIGYAIFGKGGK